MGAPVIGLTTYGRDRSGAFALPADYTEAVIRSGGVPVLLPPGVDAAPVADRLDGLILSGGGDLDPALYDGAGHSTVYMVDGERDETDVGLVRLASESGLPCLCICRGVQVLNVALGGTLVAHVPEHTGDGQAHRVPPRRPSFHDVSVEPGTRLAAILDADTTWAASWHHQAVDVVADGLIVNAHAADGTVEGLEMPGHPWLLGVQWHPEITAAHDPQQQVLFDTLAQAARVHTTAVAVGG